MGRESRANGSATFAKSYNYKKREPVQSAAERLLTQKPSAASMAMAAVLGLMAGHTPLRTKLKHMKKGSKRRR